MFCLLVVFKVVGESAAEGSPTEKPKKKHKKAAFLDFVKANPKAKILMFSGYDGTFSGLNVQLKTESIPFALLSGSQDRITKLLNEFEAGKYNVLFLNARNMGAGLNIDSATNESRIRVANYRTRFTTWTYRRFPNLNTSFRRA